jgi:hypothetical protein
MNEFESVGQSVKRHDSFLRYVMWRYQPPWIIRLEGFVLSATARPTPNSVWFIYAHSVDEFEKKLAVAHVELQDELRQAEKPPEGI